LTSHLPASIEPRHRCAPTHHHAAELTLSPLQSSLASGHGVFSGNRVYSFVFNLWQRPVTAEREQAAIVLGSDYGAVWRRDVAVFSRSEYDASYSSRFATGFPVFTALGAVGIALV
jgi:hypothetical protein